MTEPPSVCEQCLTRGECFPTLANYFPGDSIYMLCRDCRLATHTSLHPLRVIAVSGYFDPPHSGHLELFDEARKRGGRLIVIVNNDFQTRIKKGFSFYSAAERLLLVERLSRGVSFPSIDEDSTVNQTLSLLLPDVFVNSGDVDTPEKVREREVCREWQIEMVLVPGSKRQSSSALLRGHEQWVRNQLSHDVRPTNPR